MSIEKKLLIALIVTIVLCGVAILLFMRSKNSDTVSVTPDLEQVLESKAIKSEQDILTFVDTGKYFITYNKVSKEFLIVLLPSEQINQEINDLRTQAESELMTIVSMDNLAICSLKVSLIIPPSYWPEMSGVDYGLSGCGNFIPFNK